MTEMSNENAGVMPAADNLKHKPADKPSRRAWLKQHRRYLLRLGLLFRGFAPEDIHSITAPGDFANYGGISYWRLDQAALAETIALRFSNGEEGNDGGGE